MSLKCWDLPQVGQRLVDEPGGLATPGLVHNNNVSRAITLSIFKCHITPLYKQLGFLKMKDIYQLEISKLMHKFHNSVLPQSYNSFFQKMSESHTHFTRSAARQTYFIPRVGSSLGKRNLAYQGAVAWSSTVVLNRGAAAP